MNQAPAKRSAVSTKSYHGFPIRAAVNLDEPGENSIRTGIGMFDHLLELFARYAQLSLQVEATGDLNVDDHHTVDEVAMAMGTAIHDALAKGDQRLIQRNGFYIVSMDECLTTVALDLCGRSSLVFSASLKRDKLGELSTELVEPYFNMLAQRVPMTLIIKSEFGRNDHHIAEGIFKGVGSAFARAIQLRS